MKKNLLNTLFILSCLLSIFTIGYCLLPEKRNLTIENKLRELEHEETYKKDELANYKKKINDIVSQQLNEINAINQTNILLLVDAIKTNASNSSEVQKIYEMKCYNDSIHIAKVTSIINKYGWLGADRIGAQNNYTLFTVIQNSDLKTQSKFLTVMENAVKSGTLAPENYAILVDRKAVVEHQKQIFGTQITANMNTGEKKFVTIAERKNVNERRQEIGLKPIELYALQNNIKYEL